MTSTTPTPAIREVSFDLEQFDYRNTDSLEDWMVDAIFDGLRKDISTTTGPSIGRAAALGT